MSYSLYSRRPPKLSHRSSAKTIGCLLEARANQFYYMHGEEPLRSKRNTRENPPWTDISNPGKEEKN
jgi:hypothetical protein